MQCTCFSDLGIAMYVCCSPTGRNQSRQPEMSQKQRMYATVETLSNRFEHIGYCELHFDCEIGVCLLLKGGIGDAFLTLIFLAFFLANKPLFRRHAKIWVPWLRSAMVLWREETIRRLPEVIEALVPSRTSEHSLMAWT